MKPQRILRKEDPQRSRMIHIADGADVADVADGTDGAQEPELEGVDGVQELDDANSVRELEYTDGAQELENANGVQDIRKAMRRHAIRVPSPHLCDRSAIRIPTSITVIAGPNARTCSFEHAPGRYQI